MQIDQGAGVACVLGIVNIVLGIAMRRADLRRLQAEQELKEERTATAGIVKERQEIAAENKLLRDELRAELERVKAELALYRQEAERWKATAERAEQEIQGLRRRVTDLERTTRAD